MPLPGLADHRHPVQLPARARRTGTRRKPPRFYSDLIRREGGYSQTLAVNDALSVVAAVFGALLGDPDLEPKVVACDPSAIVDILAGNWGVVDGCDAEDWVAGALSSRCDAAAALFRTYADNAGKWHDRPRDAVMHDQLARLGSASPPGGKARRRKSLPGE
jgi:hypothetical protein